MNDVYAALARAIPPRRLLKDAPMRDHTTMRVGGPADVLADAAGEDDVRAVLAVCRACGAKLTVIGNGSNLLVRDGGIRGVVLRVGRHMADMRVQGEQIEAQAGRVPGLALVVVDYVGKVSPGESSYRNSDG